MGVVPYVGLAGIIVLIVVGTAGRRVLDWWDDRQARALRQRWREDNLRTESRIPRNPPRPPGDAA